MPGWLHGPIERDHCDDRGPIASVRERPHREKALESTSTSQSHSHNLHRHNLLAEPRPHKTLPSCEIKVEACHHVTGWLGEVNSILICGLITLYLLCRIPHQSGSLFLIRTPPFVEFIYTSYRQPADIYQMPLFWSKGFGGRRAGGNITADRHGIHRPVFRFRCCGLNCFH